MNVSSPFKPWYLFRPAQAFRRIIRALRTPRERIQVIELPWGCSIEVDIQETIGRSLWTTGVYDLAVAEILWRLSATDHLSLDVGANIGALTGLLARRAEEVWAFEPHPAVSNRLERNLNRISGNSGFAHCTLHSVALSDADGYAVMDIPDGFAENQGTARIVQKDSGGTRVPAARLDHLLGDRTVGVMKLDVEGHELAVLQGAGRNLASGRIRNIVFEDHVGSGSPVCELLRSNGFTIFGIGWGIFGPILAPPGRNVHRSYEAPSYLATREPNAVVASCRRIGWECLRGRSGHAGIRFAR